MPIFDDLTCDRCAHRECVMAYFAFVAAEDRILPLAHPGESEKVREYGYEWDEAKHFRRIIWRHPYVCTDCLAITYRQGYPAREWLIPLGCFTILIASCAGWGWLFHGVFGVLLAPGAMGAALAWTEFQRRRKWRRLKLSKGPMLPAVLNCTKCGAANLVEYHKWALTHKDLLLCPQCGEHGLRFNGVTGIS